MSTSKLRVLILKPSKYGISGSVERFRRGFMPNTIDGCATEIECIDEYVQTDLAYLRLLHKQDAPTLLALVGVQSHQFHRSGEIVRLCRQPLPQNLELSHADTAMNRRVKIAL